MIDKVRTKISSIYIQSTHSDIANIKKSKLSYLKEDALLAIKKEVLRIENEDVEGLLVEAGCALGGSAILIALNKTEHRKLEVYDVFGMIPPPSDRDDQDVIDRYEVIKSGQSKGIDGGDYYEYEEDLRSKVAASFENQGAPIEKKQGGIDTRFV